VDPKLETEGRQLQFGRVVLIDPSMPIQFDKEFALPDASRFWEQIGDPIQVDAIDSGQYFA
jgi:hypothetical protein